MNAQSDFVTIQGDQFIHRGQVVRLKGTNYYPKNHMWADMWNSWDWPEIQSESTMIQNLGMNCVRILVPYSAGGWNGPNPPADRLQKLEDIVNLMGQKGIRSLVTLFDWETSFPAAGTSKESDHIKYLTAIVNRLKDNRFVLMWDVKNEPDHPANIGGMDNWDTSPNKSKIVSWLNRMCNAIRSIDNNHPVSVGIRWWENVDDVLSFVDVAMFHSYWPNIGTQQIPEVKGYMGSNQKPIVVEEFGWPSNPYPCNRDGQIIYDYNETQQYNVYVNHLTAFETHNIAGCLQWMTFDAKNYTSNPNESFENYFGLWKYDYSLKPAGAYYRDNFLTIPFVPEPDTIPPNNVTGFTASGSTSKVYLAWTNPLNSDFRGTVVRCKTSGYPESPNDGILVCNRIANPGSKDSFSHTGLVNGVTYYYKAFSYDSVYNYASGVEASAVPRILNIGLVKQIPDNISIDLSGVLVSGLFPADGCFYVQEQDYSSGIRVANPGTGLAVGDIINLSGIISTRKPDTVNATERQVSTPTFTKIATGASVIPLEMNCKSVGGGTNGLVLGVCDAKGEQGSGLNNIGLLVRIAGTVTQKLSQYIFVDDGSKIAELSDRIGVMVKCPSTNIPVNVGDKVAVTGIVQGSRPIGWPANRRLIVIRSFQDLIKIN